MTKADLFQIQNLTRQPADWDGLGAKEVPRKAAHAAIGLLAMLNRAGVCKPLFVGPSSLGCVTLQWGSRPQGYRVYARVYGGLRVEVEESDPRFTWKGDVRDAVARITEAIDRFIPTSQAVPTGTSPAP